MAARSPGIKLPTRRLKRPGRSSSAIAARLPSAIAWSYASRASAALLQDALDDAAGDLHAKTGHGRTVRQWEDVGGLERLVESVHEDLPNRHARQQPVDAGSDLQRLERQLPAIGLYGAEPGVVGVR